MYSYEDRVPICEHDIGSDEESVKDAELLAKFNGEYPPTLLRIMNGVGLDPGIGFHSIALQIAITSNALDKSEDDMLALCEDLCEKHESDGTRYNTPEEAGGRVGTHAPLHGRQCLRSGPTSTAIGRRSRCAIATISSPPSLYESTSAWADSSRRR